MKTALYVSTLLMTISSAAFAHHPAAEMVDPEIYAMIDENVSDTPHADMTFDDMGGEMEAAGQAAEAREMGIDSRADIDVSMESDEMLDTMDLLENVSSQLAD